MVRGVEYPFYYLNIKRAGARPSLGLFSKSIFKIKMTQTKNKAQAVLYSIGRPKCKQSQSNIRVLSGTSPYLTDMWWGIILY